MPSWGNAENAQNQQTMDSNGRKLIVSHNDTDDAVTISNSSSGNALDVTGKTAITGKTQVVHNHASETALTAQNISGGAALAVAGPSAFAIGDVTISDNTTITKNHATQDALTVNNNLAGNALKVNGKTEVDDLVCNSYSSFIAQPLLVNEIEADDPGQGSTLTLTTDCVISTGDFVLYGSNLSTGSGFKYNSVGHGNGASIDFYIGGTLEGWIDSTGFNNA